VIQTSARRSAVNSRLASKNWRGTSRYVAGCTRNNSNLRRKERLPSTSAARRKARGKNRSSCRLIARWLRSLRIAAKRTILGYQLEQATRKVKKLKRLIGLSVLSDVERATLGEIVIAWSQGSRRGRNRRWPDGILACHRNLVAGKFDGSQARKGPGRPRLKREVEQLIIRMAGGLTRRSPA
jgi:hypothetical protein